MNMLSRFCMLALWGSAAAIYVLAVLPAGLSPAIAPDKIQHMAAFFVLAVLASLAMPRAPAIRIAAALAAFGIGIELTQSIPALHREASGMDWLADVVAIAAGMLAAAPLKRRMQETA